MPSDATHLGTSSESLLLPSSNSWSGRKMNHDVQLQSLHGLEHLLELPQDLLWKILGFLDVRTVCTARLLCKDFWRSASGHLKALGLPSTALEQPPASTFTQLSGLTTVAVVATEKHLHMLAHPRIAPVITYIDLTLNALPANLDQLFRLPKLCRLSLHGKLRGIKLLPLGLEELIFNGPIRKPASLQSASWLTGITGLKKLSIQLVAGAGRSLGCLTCLKDLRFLDLHCGISALRVLSTFTMPTGLRWDVFRSGGIGPETFLHSVGCLTGLSHLQLDDREGKLRHAHLAPLSRLTKLTHLDIRECPLAECVADSTFLVPLTCLVSLGLKCYTIGMSLLPSLNVEALQSLTLRFARGAEDVSVLQRATGLTALDIRSRGPECPQGLEAALTMMTRLQDLLLYIGGKNEGQPPFHLSLVLRPLTSLTRLVYSGEFTAGSDLSACASLPSLRGLWLMCIPEVTPACLPALQAMSGLSVLSLCHTGFSPEHVTPDVRAGFDVERLRRSWPCLGLSIDYKDV